MRNRETGLDNRSAAAALMPHQPPSRAGGTIPEHRGVDPHDTPSRLPLAPGPRQRRALRAPTDAAINRLPSGLVGDRTAGTGNSRSPVRPFVLNHLVQGNLTMQELTQGSRRLRRMNGAEVELIGEGNTVALRSLNPQALCFRSGISATGIRIETRPIEVVGLAIMASNGVIYPVNGVLI